MENYMYVSMVHVRQLGRRGMWVSWRYLESMYYCDPLPKCRKYASSVPLSYNTV